MFLLCSIISVQRDLNRIKPRTIDSVLREKNEIYTVCSVFPHLMCVLFLSQGWAAGKGKSNGNYKGHQLFTCPDGCGLILSASELTVPRSSHTSSSGDQDRQTHQPNQTSSSNGHQSHGLSTVNILSRAAESGPLPSPPALFSVGQRVCFTQDDAFRRGTVCFCGPLPDRPSSEVFVGVLLVSK